MCDYRGQDGQPCRADYTQIEQQEEGRQIQMQRVTPTRRLGMARVGCGGNGVGVAGEAPGRRRMCGYDGWRGSGSRWWQAVAGDGRRWQTGASRRVRLLSAHLWASESRRRGQRLGSWWGRGRGRGARPKMAMRSTVGARVRVDAMNVGAAERSRSAATRTAPTSAQHRTAPHVTEHNQT